ncbi:TPM domain-containing protein, partial [Streptomyces sp. NPDC049577]
AGTRAAETRARARADRALLAARTEVAAARDFLTTHRGATGCRARTRLAEAERLLPRHAADRALTLARQARALAESDIDAYEAASGREPPPQPVDRALLGGIILGDLLPATFGGWATRGRLAG